jgi:predicted MPP superfamily phosphohydrolase
VNALDPHLVVLTGDLVDGSVGNLREHTRPLADVVARDGRFYVTGNHEYYSGPEAWVREVARLGFTPLLNEHRVVDVEGARVLVAGVTDSAAGRMVPGHRSDPDAAMRDAPAADLKLFLAHQPTSAKHAAKLGAHLHISGHTHGGQFFPWHVPVRLTTPYVAGLFRVGAMWLYVSRGTGYWGPPLRLGAPSEITLFEIVRAD